MTNGDTVAVAVRIPLDLLARIDREQILRENESGLDTTRSGMVRKLLQEAVETAERNRKAKR